MGLTFVDRHLAPAFRRRPLGPLYVTRPAGTPRASIPPRGRLVLGIGLVAALSGLDLSSLLKTYSDSHNRLSHNPTAVSRLSANVSSGSPALFISLSPDFASNVRCTASAFLFPTHQHPCLTDHRFIYGTTAVPILTASTIPRSRPPIPPPFGSRRPLVLSAQYSVRSTC